ncbi:hypothetical protein AB0G49_13740 [Streptomyces longwoodensis]|uniref:hypothetical protein n=1 Tax=Streptomyces longwoodensis TaxID=68231 RepID=UPI0033E7D7F1
MPDAALPPELSCLVPDGWTLAVSPGLVRRYTDAGALPGPIQATGTQHGPITAAWCPACHGPVTGYDHDNLLARPDHVPIHPEPAQKHVGSLLTLDPCRHAFRTESGQTLFEIREPAA